MPRLRRVNDGEGSVGVRAECIKYKDGKIIEQFEGPPTIGYCYLVGTMTASTYSARDFWVTSEITEILEIRKTEEGFLEYVKFKTCNSTYECEA